MQSKHLTLRIISIGVVILALMLFGLMGVISAQDDDAPDPFLGINFDEADNGVLVTNVARATPAEDADLRGGDVITMVDDTAVTVDNFVDTILSYAVGDEIRLTIERDDETLELTVTLGERPDQATPVNPQVEVIARAFLGIVVEETDAGLEITRIIPESPAEESGMQVGDILTSIDGESVESIRDTMAVIRELEAGDEVTLTLTRDGESQDVTVTVDDVPYSGSTVTIFSANGITYHEDENAWELTELDDNHPLSEAGLQVGDWITAINDETPSPREASRLLFELLGSEDDVTLTVERDGETLEFEVSPRALLSLLGGGMRGEGFGGGFDFDMPPIIIEPNGFQFGDPRNNNRARLGVVFVTLNEQTAQEYESDVTEGAYVVEVEPESPADQAGLQVGDVITAVDGDLVDVERTLSDRLYAYESGDTITLTVLRDGETLAVEATLSGRPERASFMPFFEEGVFSMPFDFDSGFMFGSPFDFGSEFPFEIPFEQPEPSTSL